MESNFLCILVNSQELPYYERQIFCDSVKKYCWDGNMKRTHFLEDGIHLTTKSESLESDEFQKELVLDNLRRGKLLAVLIILIELIYMGIDIVSCLLKVDKAFSFSGYFTMYLIMVALNLGFLFLIRGYNKKRIQWKTMSGFLVLYITVIMVWGSVISLMDQQLYGQLMAFMINMMICSVIYLFNAKMMSIPYLISVSILAIGLPFFQNSSNVLIGHYVNLFVFVVACWVASRIIYNNYCESYVIREMVAQSKLQIEKEMEENRIVSEKLAVANAQLRQFALIDELTGLSNRRRFREYIDKVFQSNASPALTMSIIMIDVDYFKQYNDSFGHETGDKALSEIAKQIDAMVKAPDQIAVRWGGEEFIYSAFGRSSSDIVKTANALRMNILNLKISNPSSLANPYITISQGTCTGAVKSKNEVSRIIKIADQALYLAKANGRNCVATLTYQSGPDNEAP